jgi:hypothetical protein
MTISSLSEPEKESSSIYWAQLMSFHLETEIESCLGNAALKKRQDDG